MGRIPMPWKYRGNRVLQGGAKRLYWREDKQFKPIGWRLRCWDAQNDCVTIFVALDDDPDLVTLI